MSEISSYSVIEVDYKNDPEDVEQLFISRKKDGKYHLIGDRPKKYWCYFSEHECTLLDMGVVILPDKKEHLDELVEGDAIQVKREDGNSGPFNNAKYLRKV